VSQHAAKNKEYFILASINQIIIALEEYKDILRTLKKIFKARILSFKLPASLVKRIKGFIKT
jgi:hypothetical protein